MGYGDGSITEIKKPDGKSYNPKKWRVCLSFTVETQDAEGNPKRKRKKIQRNISGTKAQAKALRDRLFEEYDDQGRLKDAVALEKQIEEVRKETTLSDFIATWNDVRITIGKANQRTIKEDLTRLRHIEEFLGNTPITQITPQMVDEAYARIRKEHGLSGTTLNRIHILLKNVFEKAIDYDIIVKNPCSKVETPRINTPDRKALSEDEGALLLERIEQAEAEEYRAFLEKEARMARIGKTKGRASVRGLHTLGNIIAVRIGLATGMRRGEVMGLTWEHVSLEGYAITVRQSLDVKGNLKAPKTNAGIRTLAIYAATCASLARWKALQMTELAKICIEQRPGTPVCCTDTGSFNRPDNFEHWWAKWREENGFAGLKFHELRHTQATVLLSNNVDLKTVQTRMGHANPSITLGWYAHAIPENDHDAAQMLGELFAKSEEGNDEGEGIDGNADECPPDVP